MDNAYYEFRDDARPFFQRKNCKYCIRSNIVCCLLCLSLSYHPKTIYRRMLNKFLIDMCVCVRTCVRACVCVCVRGGGGGVASTVSIVEI